MTRLSFDGLVNRKRVIATLEDKANITGYQWKLPRNIPKGFVEKRSKNGGFLHYSHTDPVTIQDVDGREKRTTRTAFFDANKQPKNEPAPFHGEWIEGLAGKYHGTLSRNWKQENLTLTEIINLLNAGYAYAPGYFDPPEGKSQRSADYCEHRYVLLLDGDEWTSEHPPPRDLDDFLNRYPNLSEDFYWIGESISSRSCLKPELRTRMMLVLPKPIYKGEEALWETVIDTLVERYPFIARGVGIDKVRLSFGNARPESENRVLGGMISEAAFRQWEATAAEKERHQQHQEQEKAQRREKRGRARAAQDAVQSELARRGYQSQTLIDPLVAFCETDAVKLLQEIGATHLHGETWNWHESGPGRSFELKDGTIKPFSNSMQVASPEVDGTKPINAHRFFLYYQYQLDITKDRDKHELRCQLADVGYGTHPDVYREAKAAEREAAIREGLISPEEHQDRRSSLSITGEFHETLVALKDNEQTLAHAFTQALQKPNADIPHYHILHFEMGSGKNHAFLTSLKALHKRGIGIFENHEQVDEQVSKAFDEFGLSAMGFRGRGYKFKESGLSGIPVKMRQMDEGLFEKFPEVVCGFYDSIEKWESKGLGAYEYCLDCPFLKRCPYLSQFESVSEVDFLGICMHDLFFDPGLWAFLKRIWHRGEETEEEQVIGNALGIGSGVGSMEFDIGVLDEVVARNLYLSYEYALEDFQALACSWNGEALGDFMTEILRCFQDKGSTDRHAEIKVYLQTLDKGMREQIHEQMTQIPKLVRVHQHTQRDKETSAVLSEYFVRDDAANEWRIPVSVDAESILRQKRIATLPYQSRLPKGKIGVSPYSELRSGRLTLSDIKGRLWSKEWTLLHQLETAVKTDVQWIGTKYNIEGDQVCCDTVTLTIPPQANAIIKRLVLMGGTMDVENIQRAFAGQSVGFSVSDGKTAAYAPGVQTFQLTDRRLTFQSVFELEKDAKGKTVYDNETNAPAVIGLTPSATKDLEQICRLAERHIAAGNLLPVFISYKNFTEPSILDLLIVQRMHRCLQVKHFDLTRGLNFQGVKVFIIYGYPKSARPDVVQKTAETLYHAETEPLDFTYERCDEEGEGYKAMNIGKFRDARLESVRQQLTRDKSKQALYRSRPTRWSGTTTLHFSAEPIPGWTERATGFTRTDFHRAENFEALGEVVATREHAEAEGDVQTLVAGAGVSKSTAYRNTEGKRKQNKKEAKQKALALYADGLSFAEISAHLGGKPSERTIRRWVEAADF